MGNAGRVLMIPKGDYNAATTYERLDFVYYQGRSYVCKQTSTGNAPTNTTYWQALTGDASAEIQALTNQLNTSINDLGAKNSLPLSVAKIKALNPDVTWDNNSCVWKGITYTILTDSAGNVTGIDADGTATERGWLFLSDDDLGNTSINFGSNPTVGGYTYSIGGSGWMTNILDVVYNSGLKKSYYLIDNEQTLSHKVAYPMRRPAGITDDTFAPYAKTNLELTQDVTIENISNSFYDSLETGMSVLDAAVYKQGKHIFGSFVVQSTDAFEVSSATAVMTLKYAPIVSINTFFALGNAQWGSVQTLGYMYINRASKSMTLEVRDADKHFAKIMIDYAIA